MIRAARALAGGLLFGLAAWWLLVDVVGRLRRPPTSDTVSGIRVRPLRPAELREAIALERELGVSA